MRLNKLSWFVAPVLCTLVLACGKGGSEKGESGSSAAIDSSSAPASASASASAESGPRPLIERDADHVGGVIARAPDTDSVFIADEDHGLVRYIADTSPLLAPKSPAASDSPEPAKPPPIIVVSSAAPRASGSAKAYGSAKPSPSAAPTSAPKAPKVVAGETTIAQETLAMGGAPANLIAIRDGALVTLRDPGKLVRVRKGDDGKLSVVHEVAVAADAWGVALNEAGTRALVTSAWTNTVTLVEVSDAGLKKCAEVAVGREPRGVTFASDSLAYVNHLVGNEITKIAIRADCDSNGIGEVKRVVVPPSPVRSPTGKILPASMGYSIALSPDKKRLFLPRHALGARSHSSWFGSTTVDALLLPAETPAAPMHEADLPGVNSTHLANWGAAYEFDNQPVEAWAAFIQPRDIRYRRSLNTVVVASEGADRLVEMDATAMDPSYAIAALYELNDSVRRGKNDTALRPGSWPDGWRRDSYANPSDANASDNHACAAPQGLVLDSSESAALVFCRASTTVVAVGLQKELDGGPRNTTVLTFASLGADAAGVNLGRRLFYSSVMAEGMGCAGCHPEGRDDGHVWREITLENGAKRFLGGPDIFGPAKGPRGVPRRTPMLFGRLLPVGPYGWRAESETLEKRIAEGTQLHAGEYPPTVPEYYVNALGVFLRKGLTKPPARAASLTPEEQKGKAVFEDAKTACTVCHEPTRYFSNYTAMKLGALPTLAGYEPESDALFKTPSLLFVSNHGSLLHDGSAKSLDELIEKNGTRMGDTAHLTAEDRKALVAYLKTL